MFAIFNPVYPCLITQLHFLCALEISVQRFSNLAAELKNNNGTQNVDKTFRKISWNIKQVWFRNGFLHALLSLIWMQLSTYKIFFPCKCLETLIFCISFQTKLLDIDGSGKNVARIKSVTPGGGPVVKTATIIRPINTKVGLVLFDVKLIELSVSSARNIVKYCVLFFIFDSSNFLQFRKRICFFYLI